jgi:hypothetical protein
LKYFSVFYLSSENRLDIRFTEKLNLKKWAELNKPDDKAQTRKEIVQQVVSKVQPESNLTNNKWHQMKKFTLSYQIITNRL